MHQLTEQEIRNFRMEQEYILEYAVRYMIPCPIKGEITKRKVDWRGLHLISNAIPDLQNQTVDMLDSRLVIKQSKSGKRKIFSISLREIIEDEGFKKWRQHQKKG